MSDKDDLISALQSAHDAGDTDAVEHLAKALNSLPDEKPAAKPAKVKTKAEPDPIGPDDFQFGELGDIHPGTMASSAWNATKRLSAGVDQLKSKLWDDPIDRVASKLTGQGAEANITARNKMRDAYVAQVQGELDKNLDKAPISALAGELAPAALAGPMSPEIAGLGAAGRIAGPAIGAGVVSALEPTSTSNQGAVDFAKEKAGQFTLGAALGAIPAGLGEAGGAVKKFVNSRFLFGDVGTAESPIQKYWQKAKDMGFNISPQQARQDAGRLQTPGVTYTQREQNRIAANAAATKPTGMPSGVIDKDYLGDGFRRTSGEYDKIYGPNTSFKVDGAAISQLQDFVDKSTAAQLGNPWANKEAMAAAEKLLAAYHGVAGTAGAGKNIKMNVDGQTLNRLVSELKSSSAKIKDGFEREDLGEVINSINESVARNNPAARAALDKVNPQYRTLKTLENLSQRGGIDANGNIDPMALAKLLRGSDRGYLRGNSTHPLKDLAEVGETFGIRAQSQPTVAGGKPTSGVDVPTTRSGLLQAGVEHGKEMLPGFKAGFTRYKLGESGNGLNTEEQNTIADLAAAAKMESDRENTHR